MTAPRTDWQESIRPDEAERFERLAAQLRAARPRPPGDAWRALHAKRVAGLRGEFTVFADVPPQARAGIFASPGTYKAYVRFSNGAAGPQADTIADVRGMAIKLLGIPGTKLLPGLESATTQDFLTIHSAFTPFNGPEEFVWVACAAQRQLTFLPRAVLHLGPLRALRLIGAIKRDLARPFPSYALGTFHSALAIRFGDYAVRYSLAPDSPPDGETPVGTTPDYLHADLGDRLRRGSVHFIFRVQFYVAADRTPIEDTAVEWRESDSPFVPVARLTLPRQDLDDEAGRRLAEYVERLSFDPWHAPVEFRPLGAMMRARRAAYRVSAAGRGAAAEPEGADWPA